jgi:hypothetical protein
MRPPIVLNADAVVIDRRFKPKSTTHGDNDHDNARQKNDRARHSRERGRPDEY